MLQDSRLIEKQASNNNSELVGTGVKFERIRRITGYLVGTLDRFNNAKRDEESQRIKHGLNFGCMR